MHLTVQDLWGNLSVVADFRNLDNCLAITTTTTTTTPFVSSTHASFYQKLHRLDQNLMQETYESFLYKFYEPCVMGTR